MNWDKRSLTLNSHKTKLAVNIIRDARVLEVRQQAVLPMSRPVYRHWTHHWADWFLPPITLGQRLVFNNRLGQTHHHHQTLPVSCQRLWWWMPTLVVSSSPGTMMSVTQSSSPRHSSVTWTSPSPRQSLILLWPFRAPGRAWGCGHSAWRTMTGASFRY